MNKMQKKNKIQKGEYGYIVSERKKEILLSIVGMAIVLGFYFLGIYLSGSNKNIYTVMAVLSVIPTSQHLVRLIILGKHTSVNQKHKEELAKAIKEKKGTILYDVLLSSNEQLYYLPVVYVERKHILAYTTCKQEKKIDLEEYMKKNISAQALLQQVWLTNQWEDFTNKLKGFHAKTDDAQLTEQRLADLQKNDEMIISTIKSSSV